MASAPELSPSTERPTVASSTLGLALEVDARIEIPGVFAPPRPGPRTRIRLDPEGLRRRWQAVQAGAERVREQHHGDGTLLLSVDLAPPAGYLLHAPGFARILVAPDGTEILCDPEPGNPDWAALVGAQALPLAATLQGLEVLHASGVVLKDNCLAGDGQVGGRWVGGALLFAGPQGAGKSSLAAALARRGAALLGDDTVALESRGGRLTAHAGPALLHLRADEPGRAGSGAGGAVSSAGVAAPGKRRLQPGATAAAAPLGGLFLLERASGGEPVQRIEAADPYALLASTFNLSVRTPERLIRHLDLAAQIAAGERVYRVRVQPGLDATQLAAILLERLPEL